MKKLIIFISAITISISSYAQTPAFEKSDLVFNAGIGFGSGLYGTGYKTTMTAISLSGEYGIVDDIFTDGLNLGVGGYVGFAGSKYEHAWFGGNYSLKTNYTVIGARGAFHYTFVDNLDTYAGVMLGYKIVSVKETGTAQYGFKTQGSEITSAIYIGARYYLTNNFAVMGELGTGVAYVNIGVSLKL